MDKFKAKLNRMLTRQFSGAEVNWEPRDREDPRISGFLVWNGFEGKDQVTRQQKLWTLLRRELTAAEQQKILAIFTTTPAEMAVMQD